MSGPNNVRGPTSALTEFLRESGINATSIARRVATRNAQNHEQPVAGSSNQARSDSTEPTQPQSLTRSRRQRTRTRSGLRYSGNASDDLDNSGPEQEVGSAAVQAEAQTTTGKKRKLSKAAEAKLKAKEKKKRGIKDSDEDMDEDDDTYNAPSRLMRGATDAGTGRRPAPGSFADCVKCEEQFTVTIYTMAAIPGPGWLCHSCAKASGNDPFKKKRTAQKKNPAEKRTVTNFEERRFPSLVSLCVQLITKYIDDVEALGDIGTMNVEAISKALSKNRSLTSENVQLFYNTTNTTLALYDATNLSPDAFTTLGYLNPNLTSLRLDFCGQINDEAFNTLSTSIPALNHIELLGPFLVKPPSWQRFFTTHPNLEKCLITQSPRFDLDCLRSLLSSCGSTLQALRLKEIGKLNDEFLLELAKLGQNGNTSKLNYLDLSDPEVSCEEEAMVELLSSIGSKLTELNVSKHILLTDGFLTEGLLPHTTSLETLMLNHLPELSNNGVARFFKSWTNNPPLVRLDLSRNPALADKSFNAVLDHSGENLEELSVNGWKDLGEDALVSLAIKAPALRKVDVGWVREMSDFVVKAWVDGVPETTKNMDEMEVDGQVVRKGGCGKLEEIRVWGCNRITLKCPRKMGMSIYGAEAHTVIRTFA